MKKLALLGLVAALGAACSNQDTGGQPGRGEDPPPTDYLTIESDDGTVYTVAEAPTIRIVEEDPPRIAVEFEGLADDGGTWWIHFQLAEDEFLAGVAEVRLVGETATVPGIANAAYVPVGNATVYARDGQAQVELADGWLIGHVWTDDPRIAGSFRGGYQLTCSVLPEHLGLPRSDDPNYRQQDDDFASEFCQRFAAQRPPVE